MTRFTLPFLCLVLSAGCAPDDGEPGNPPSVDAGRRLELLGAPDISVDAQSQAVVAFRLVDGTSPVAGDMIDFELRGQTAGATLSAASAVTDASGVGEIVVRTDGETAFELVATAVEAESARVFVNVRPLAVGTLNVEVSYAGARDVRSAELGVFANARCEDIARGVPSPRASANSAIGGRSEFVGLELNIPMAVYVLGIDTNDHVAAETCSDVTLTQPQEAIRVPLADVAMRLAGPYATRETFDVTDGFPTGLDVALEVLGALASDDPALYLIEIIADNPETPGWVRTALGSSFTRELVADLFREALESVQLPSAVTSIGNFAADVEAAFNSLTLIGQLDFPEPDEYLTANGQHRLSAVEVELADGRIGQRPYDLGTDVVVTFGERIDMAEHTFTLPFGEVVEMVFYLAGLSELEGSPRSLGDLVGSFIDCAAVADYVGDGTLGSLAQAACTSGVNIVSNRVDDALESLWDFDQLHLAGNAALSDADGDYDYELIEAGEATARWTGASGELDFDGVFEGASLNDPSTGHPVRERLRGLE